MVVSIHQEKRETIRVRSIHLLSYSYFGSDEAISDLGMARTLNISEKGILIELHREIPAGSQIEVTLSVPDECLTVRGVVVRSENQGNRWRSAVKFSNLPLEAQQRISSYLDVNFPYTRDNY